MPSPAALIATSLRPLDPDRRLLHRRYGPLARYRRCRSDRAGAASVPR